MADTGQYESLADGLDETETKRPSGGKSPDRRQMVVVGVGVVSVLVALGFTARFVLGGGPDPKNWSQQRTLIDSQTLEVFEGFKISDGDAPPYEHPKTSDRTLFPAEACYWTADGGVKLEATWVLLNEYVDSKEPTKCPDCGHRVVGHNPMPPIELMMAEQERQSGG